MKILLSGASGQLGRSLQTALSNHAVTALVRGQLDIANLQEVREALSAHSPDLVVNAAAFNEVDKAQTDEDAAYRANALGPRNLALAAAERGSRLLHVSSDYVFDGTRRAPYHEYCPPGPISVYGRSKLAGEDAVRDALDRHYVVRTAWLYHVHGRNFPNTILALGRKGPVRVVNDQRGSPTYAPHLAAGIARLIETGAYGTYHLAGLGGASWFELAEALFAKAGIGNPVLPVPASEFPRPAPRPSYSVLATIQDPRILLPPWEEGIEAFVREAGIG